jgi:hypothetical protein
MAESNELGSDSHEQSQLKAIMRFAAFALPLLVTTLVFLFGWRRHFGMRSVEAGGIWVALSVYMAIYFKRRSRGLSARIFLDSTGPHRDEDGQGRSDIGALWGAAVFVGCVAYMLFEYW